MSWLATKLLSLSYIWLSLLFPQFPSPRSMQNHHQEHFPHLLNSHHKQQDSVQSISMQAKCRTGTLAGKMVWTWLTNAKIFTKNSYLKKRRPGDNRPLLEYPTAINTLNFRVDNVGHNIIFYSFGCHRISQVTPYFANAHQSAMQLLKEPSPLLRCEKKFLAFNALHERVGHWHIFSCGEFRWIVWYTILGQSVRNRVKETCPSLTLQRMNIIEVGTLFEV